MRRSHQYSRHGRTVSVSLGVVLRAQTAFDEISRYDWCPFVSRALIWQYNATAAVTVVMVGVGKLRVCTRSQVGRREEHAVPVETTFYRTETPETRPITSASCENEFWRWRWLVIFLRQSKVYTLTSPCCVYTNCRRLLFQTTMRSRDAYAKQCSNDFVSKLARAIFICIRLQNVHWVPPRTRHFDELMYLTYPLPKKYATEDSWKTEMSESIDSDENG